MFDFEINIVTWFREIATPFTDLLFEGITALGEQQILILVLIVIYFMYSKKAGQRIAFSVFGSLLFNNTLKGIVLRDRPFTRFPDDISAARLESATGSSFPSGHTQNAAVAYTSIGLLFKKKKLWIAISALIFLIGLSRVVLGVHYPTDVIVGAFLGITFAYVGASFHQRVENNFKKQIVLYLIVALFFLPFVFIFWRKNYESIEVYSDFYKSYAFYLGYIFSVIIEHKFVDFDCKNNLSVRTIRTVIAIIIVVIIQFGLSFILPDENILMDMVRYFLIAFIGLGVYPIIAKKSLFYK